jgi:hypothetical protein
MSTIDTRRQAASDRLFWCRHRRRRLDGRCELPVSADKADEAMSATKCGLTFVKAEDEELDTVVTSTSRKLYDRSDVPIGH